jgi:DNA-binding FrmR family transcriptional regulator
MVKTAEQIEDHVHSCGCAVHDSSGRKAVAVDPGIRDRNLKRLRRIEGQVTQISSVQEALRGVGRELMRNHLKHCATAAIKAGPDEAEPMYDELIDLMYRNLR